MKALTEDAASSGPVSWWTAGDVLIVHMTHPPVNALGDAMLAGLADALSAFDASTAKVALIASAVPGFFAAGADIKRIAGGDRAAFAAYGHAMRTPMNRLASHRRPSIAVLEGRALGGGLELALAATLRVAARDALLGLPEVRLGLIPGAGGTQRLPRLVGRSNALQLMLTGAEISAARALEMGLVDRLSDPGQAFDDAMALATELAALPSAALDAIVRCVDDAADLPFARGLAVEADRINELFDTDDAREGIAAFLQRRAPKFG
jgi:enoyl-CoA hydratase